MPHAVQLLICGGLEGGPIRVNLLARTLAMNQGRHFIIQEDFVGRLLLHTHLRIQ